MWLELKLTSKGDFCVVSLRVFFVNFFMHSHKQAIPEWVSIVTFHPRHKIYSSTPQSETTSIPVTYMGLPPPGPHVLSLLLGVISSVTHNQLFLLTGDMMAKYSSFLQFETRLTSENLILTSCLCLRPRARRDKLNILQRTVLY